MVTLAGKSPSAAATSAAGRPGTRSAVPAGAVPASGVPPAPGLPAACQPGACQPGPASAGTCQHRAQSGRLEPPERRGPVRGAHHRRPRRADDLRGRPGRHHAPVGQHHQARALLCFLHAVRGHDDPRAVGGRLRDRLPQPGPGQRVDARRRLVEQQEFGCVRQHLRERRAPGHPERQVPHGDRRVPPQRIRHVRCWSGAVPANTARENARFSAIVRSS